MELNGRSMKVLLPQRMMCSQRPLQMTKEVAPAASGRSLRLACAGCVTAAGQWLLNTPSSFSISGNFRSNLPLQLCSVNSYSSSCVSWDGSKVGLPWDAWITITKYHRPGDYRRRTFLFTVAWAGRFTTVVLACVVCGQVRRGHSLCPHMAKGGRRSLLSTNSIQNDVIWWSNRPPRAQALPKMIRLRVWLQHKNSERDILGPQYRSHSQVIRNYIQTSYGHTAISATPYSNIWSGQ